MLSQTDRHELHITHHLLHLKECLVCIVLKKFAKGAGLGWNISRSVMHIC